MIPTVASIPALAKHPQSGVSRPGLMRCGRTCAPAATRPPLVSPAGAVVPAGTFSRPAKAIALIR
ncbi:MAG: hypothetical protein ABSB01_05825 [Streptosporangiaceae bacterium]|jgi:hypothetical protein